MNKSVLVVYYSHSGNTAKAAAEIARRTGGALQEIQPVNPYPQEYRAVVEQAKKEIPAGIHPEIQPMELDFGAYDLVIAGSPNWCGTFAPPVATFLASQDWKGKELAVFCTHGGSGLAKMEADAARLCPDAKLTPGCAIRNGDPEQAAPALDDWLKTIGC